MPISLSGDYHKQGYGDSQLRTIWRKYNQLFQETKFMTI